MSIILVVYIILCCILYCKKKVLICGIIGNKLRKNN